MCFQLRLIEDRTVAARFSVSSSLSWRSVQISAKKLIAVTQNYPSISYVASSIQYRTTPECITSSTKVYELTSSIKKSCMNFRYVPLSSNCSFNLSVNSSSRFKVEICMTISTYIGNVSPCSLCTAESDVSSAPDS